MSREPLSLEDWADVRDHLTLTEEMIEDVLDEALAAGMDRRTATIYIFSSCGIDVLDICSAFDMSKSAVYRKLNEAERMIRKHLSKSWVAVYDEEMRRTTAHSLPERPTLPRHLEICRMHLEEQGFETAMPAEVAPNVILTLNKESHTVSRLQMMRLALGGRIEVGRMTKKTILAIPLASIV
jgi:hypothetical protein